MPYKYRKDKRANHKMKSASKQLAFFRSMGLEPTRINSNKSDLRCRYCHKKTSRSCPHKYRHEEWCSFLPTVAEVLKVPISDLLPKPRVYKQRPTEAELQQRRRNSSLLAKRRKGVKVIDYEPGAPLT